MRASTREMVDFLKIIDRFLYLIFNFLFSFINRISPVNECLDKGDGGAGDDGEEDAQEDPELGDSLKRIRKLESVK